MYYCLLFSICKNRRLLLVNIGFVMCLGYPIRTLCVACNSKYPNNVISLLMAIKLDVASCGKTDL
jgi:hypothetical protein